MTPDCLSDGWEAPAVNSNFLLFAAQFTENVDKALSKLSLKTNQLMTLENARVTRLD
ncbi:MAG: hypothetical protein PF694_10995 [Bacteroidetes bacterium]|jgi:hypothetical protein|nr:hypothetical protein [Bacteroidota bacterium]